MDIYIGNRKIDKNKKVKRLTIFLDKEPKKRKEYVPVKRTTPRKGSKRYGEANSFFGKKHTELSKNKMRLAKLGKSLSEEHIKRIRETRKFGEENKAYKNGLSKEKYPTNWTERLKDSIRMRDNYRCRICRVSEKEATKKYKKSLNIHHIDYNKFNLNPVNLISLCQSCHGKTGENRNLWKEYFKKLIKYPPRF